MNTHVDLAIVGDGLAACLLALAFARLRPDLALIMIAPSAGPMGGDALEICVDSQIPASLVAVIEPLIVKLWPEVKLVLPSRTLIHAEPAYLIDPAQLEMDVLLTLPAQALIRGAEIAALTDHSVRLADRNIVAAAVLDLRVPARILGEGFTSRGEMIGWDGVADLSLPVFADYSFTGLSKWTYLQQVPLGGERLWMRFIGHVGAADGKVPMAEGTALQTSLDSRALLPPTPLSATLRLCQTLLETRIATSAMRQQCDATATDWQRAIDGAVALVANDRPSDQTA